MSNTTPHEPGDAPPPIGRTWPRLYAAVILLLLAVIIALHLFTRAFS